MHNYKALKSASKVSVQKVKVVDVAADEDKGIEEQSHEELQLVCKKYDPDTGEGQDDKVTTYQISDISGKISYCKSKIVSLQTEQAELEQLEKDLKAL